MLNSNFISNHVLIGIKFILRSDSDCEARSSDGSANADDQTSIPYNIEVFDCKFDNITATISPYNENKWVRGHGSTELSRSEDIETSVMKRLAKEGAVYSREKKKVNLSAEEGATIQSLVYAVAVVKVQTLESFDMIDTKNGNRKIYDEKDGQKVRESTWTLQSRLDDSDGLEWNVVHVHGNVDKYILEPFWPLTENTEEKNAEDDEKE